MAAPPRLGAAAATKHVQWPCHISITIDGSWGVDPSIVIERWRYFQVHEGINRTGEHLESMVIRLLHGRGSGSNIENARRARERDGQHATGVVAQAQAARAKMVLLGHEVNPEGTSSSLKLAEATKRAEPGPRTGFCAAWVSKQRQVSGRDNSDASEKLYPSYRCYHGRFCIVGSAPAALQQ
ncbi:hypothetical protein K438DRAFT_1755425 [Mycena galopus ATCC 62051]|nr:hypothetical protein K438DRAFT_1755425 [Mycena galopus ATCC 62051]